MGKIYVHTTSRQSFGVFCSEDRTNQFIVSVEKRPQSNMYTIKMDGKDYKRNHYDASEAWTEAAYILSARIETLPAKFIKKEFDIYKQHAKMVKEAKEKLQALIDGTAPCPHEDLCQDLPWK